MSDLHNNLMRMARSIQDIQRGLDYIARRDHYDGVFALGGHTLTIGGDTTILGGGTLALDGATLALPVPIAQGGTGATTAAAARSSLAVAPNTAKYIVQTASAELSAEQALDALATGIVKVDGTTGALSSLGDPLPAANGGTGVNNASRTITIGGNSGTLNFSAASKTLTIADSGTLDLNAHTLTLSADTTLNGTPPTGSGTTNQVAYWSSAAVLASNGNMTFTPGTGTLNVGNFTVFSQMGAGGAALSGSYTINARGNGATNSTGTIQATNSAGSLNFKANDDGTISTRAGFRWDLGNYVGGGTLTATGLVDVVINGRACKLLSR